MITIEKWQGLITNASPYAVPPGACVVQTNLQCIRPGQLQGRPGLQLVVSLGGPGQIVAAARVVGGSERVIAQIGGELVVQAIT